MLHCKKLLSSTIIGAAVGVLPSSIVFAQTHTNYAVLFSGGYNAQNNHDRYYDQTLRMWNILTQTPDLNFDVNNVHVLFADGTDPAVDRSSDVSSDWSSIVNTSGNIVSASAENLQTTITSLASIIDENSSFYFWSFDHLFSIS